MTVAGPYLAQARRDALGLFLTRVAARSTLTDAERQAVLDLPGDFAKVRTNQDLVKLGEVVNRTCLVVDGMMGRFGQTRDGQRQISALYIPGDMPDLHSFVLPRSSWALTGLANSTVMRIPHAAIDDLVLKYPALASAFWRDCVLDAASAVEWVLNIGRRDARARLAHLMCELASRYEQIGRLDGLSFPLSLTQTHLADALGLTPVHINRMLAQLRRANILHISGKVVHIDDWAGLISAGDFDAGYLHLDNIGNVTRTA